MAINIEINTTDLYVLQGGPAKMRPTYIFAGSI